MDVIIRTRRELSGVAWELPSTQDLFSNPPPCFYYLIGFGLAFTVLVTVDCILHTIKHKQASERNTVRKYTLIILPVLPFVSTLSVVCIMVPRASPLFEVFLAVYEVIVLRTLMALYGAYFGGDDHMARYLSRLPKRHFLSPFPCCFAFICFPFTVTMTSGWLRFLRGLVNLLVVVRPILALTGCVLAYTTHLYVEGNMAANSIFLWVAIVQALVMIGAVYGLLVVTHAIETPLEAWMPRRKFFAVKLLLLSTVIVGFVTGYLRRRGVLQDEQEVLMWTHFSTICFSLLFAGVFRLAFHTEDYGRELPDLDPETPDGKEEQSGVSQANVPDFVSNQPNGIGAAKMKLTTVEV